MSVTILLVNLYAMPIEFTCPYCFKKTIVGEQFIGQDGPCVGCGKTITIPAPKRAGNPAANPVVNEKVVRKLPNSNRSVYRSIQQVVLIASVLSVALVIVYWIVWPFVIELKQRHDIAACKNNLQRIAKALNAYAAQYGTYPPPVVKDGAGAPMHSWRVLILPFLDEGNLYAQYNFDYPWDSPENAQLMAQCPQVYISPSVTGNATAGNSSYMLITGPGTIFPNAGPLAPQQVLDETDETLLVVEVRNPISEWTRPGDIEFQKLNATIGATTANSIGGNHTGGATVVFASGRAVWLPADVSPALLRSIITANGQEPIDETWFQGK